MRKIDIKPDWVFAPQPMYMIGTKNDDGSPNFCVITWLGFSFDQTPHLMMTIGGSKRTKTNILRERSFSANIVTQDNLWLADYFGSASAEEKIKNELPYSYTWGKAANVPVLEASHWIYECSVDRVIELDGAHLFVAKIENIQIDEDYADMDLKHIDLERLRPVIYSPYQYYGVCEKLGEMGEWEERVKRTER